jgi:hypothetical protein
MKENAVGEAHRRDRTGAKHANDDLVNKTE